jgi:hypothetical protein
LLSGTAAAAAEKYFFPDVDKVTASGAITCVDRRQTVEADAVRRRLQYPVAGSEAVGREL